MMFGQDWAYVNRGNQWMNTEARRRREDDKVRGWQGEISSDISTTQSPVTNSLRLCALYVQNTIKTFYYRSSCSRDDERSEESCEHDDWPTTDRVSAFTGRHRAGSKPVSCLFARTAV
jgi:hypothetical protein